MNDEEKPYKTDEFGRPDDRNYTYRIPIDDTRAFRKASMHLKGFTDRWVDRLKDHDGSDIGHMVIQTKDDKGHLSGLTEYQYSAKWERPFKHSRHDWEIRPANKGGTKIRGTFSAFDEAGFQITIPFDTTVSQTVSTVKAIANGEADSDVRNDFEEQMHWVKNDAIDAHRERVFEAQQDCDHEHFVRDDSAFYDDPSAVGYCEDCGAELDDNGNIVGGRTM